LVGAAAPISALSVIGDVVYVSNPQPSALGRVIDEHGGGRVIAVSTATQDQRRMLITKFGFEAVGVGRSSASYYYNFIAEQGYSQGPEGWANKWLALLIPDHTPRCVAAERAMKQMLATPTELSRQAVADAMATVHEVISAAVKAFQPDDWLEDSDRGTGDTLSERREGAPCTEATYALMRELQDHPLHGFYDFGAGHLQQVLVAATFHRDRFVGGCEVVERRRDQGNALAHRLGLPIQVAGAVDQREANTMFGEFTTPLVIYANDARFSLPLRQRLLAGVAASAQVGSVLITLEEATWAVPGLGASEPVDGTFSNSWTNYRARQRMYRRVVVGADAVDASDHISDEPLTPVRRSIRSVREAQTGQAHQLDQQRKQAATAWTELADTLGVRGSAIKAEGQELYAKVALPAGYLLYYYGQCYQSRDALRRDDPEEHRQYVIASSADGACYDGEQVTPQYATTVNHRPTSLPEGEVGEIASATLGWAYDVPDNFYGQPYVQTLRAHSPGERITANYGDWFNFAANNINSGEVRQRMQVDGAESAKAAAARMLRSHKRGRAAATKAATAAARETQRPPSTLTAEMAARRAEWDRFQGSNACDGEGHEDCIERLVAHAEAGFYSSLHAANAAACHRDIRRRRSADAWEGASTNGAAVYLAARAQRVMDQAARRAARSEEGEPPGAVRIARAAEPVRAATAADVTAASTAVVMPPVLTTTALTPATTVLTASPALSPVRAAPMRPALEAAFQDCAHTARSIMRPAAGEWRAPLDEAADAAREFSSDSTAAPDRWYFNDMSLDSNFSDTSAASPKAVRRQRRVSWSPQIERRCDIPADNQGRKPKGTKPTRKAKRQARQPPVAHRVTPAAAVRALQQRASGLGPWGKGTQARQALSRQSTTTASTAASTRGRPRQPGNTGRISATAAVQTQQLGRGRGQGGTNSGFVLTLPSRSRPTHRRHDGDPDMDTASSAHQRKSRDT